MSESTISFSDSTTGQTVYTVKCGHCDHVVFGGRAADAPLPSANDVLADHLEQHRPGRALDVTVDWEPSALCSVCEDGIGMIEEQDGMLVCTECGTTWELDGTNGEREAQAERTDDD